MNNIEHTNHYSHITVDQDKFDLFETDINRRFSIFNTIIGQKFTEIYNTEKSINNKVTNTEHTVINIINRLNYLEWVNNTPWYKKLYYIIRYKSLKNYYNKK